MPLASSFLMHVACWQQSLQAALKVTEVSLPVVLVFCASLGE